jgi:magnesium chelatase family protein
VIAARQRQLNRAGKVNALIQPKEIKRDCRITQQDAQWLEEVLNQLGLSVRAWQRILKVARTIADLGKKESIQREHLHEALSYRGIDRLLSHLQKSLE